MKLNDVGDSDLRERCAYLGIGPDELSLLYRLRSRFAECEKAVAQQLLDALQAVPALEERLRMPGVLESIRATHPDYLLSFTKRRFDEPGFAEPRRALGRGLESLGIGPEWVVRGYAIYFSLLAPVAAGGFPDDGDAAGRVVSALARRVGLDVELVLDGYVGRQREGFSHTAEALAQEGRQLRDDLTLRAEELREAREQAREAGELASLGTLAAGLAHEIGTPMGVIQGHARLLARDPGAADAGWRLQTIQDQISRITRIIQTLLRIASPKRAAHAPLELAPLIEESLEFLGERLRGQDVVVKRALDGEARVVADGERLQQLFLNLFLNAADAMPEGGELRVDVGRSAGEVLVRVADTGSGIAPEHLGRIFEPFFTTKAAGHGNGLGLMVCKRIVAEHGGTIGVSSGPETGTVFTIRLPGEAGES